MGNKHKSLPKWAQEEIERLKSNLAIADSALSMALGAIETKIEVNPYKDALGNKRCFIAEGETIRYHLPQGYVDVQISDNRLLIRSRDTMGLFPSSGNSVDVCNIEDK